MNIIYGLMIFFILIFAEYCLYIDANIPALISVIVGVVLSTIHLYMIKSKQNG